jgi:hypothetical protein
VLKHLYCGPTADRFFEQYGGLSSTSKVEDLWITRLGTAYCSPTLFSLIVVTLCVVQNSSHLVTTTDN